MRARPWILVLVALLAAACGDSATAPADVNINGTWEGEVSTLTITVTLSESDGTVTGSGNITGPDLSIANQVSGTRSGANLSLTLSAEGFAPADFTGTIADESTITGNLTGSGFAGTEITMTRQ